MVRSRHRASSSTEVALRARTRRGQQSSRPTILARRAWSAVRHLLQTHAAAERSVGTQELVRVLSRSRTVRPGRTHCRDGGVAEAIRPSRTRLARALASLVLIRSRGTRSGSPASHWTHGALGTQQTRVRAGIRGPRRTVVASQTQPGGPYCTVHRTVVSLQALRTVVLRRQSNRRGITTSRTLHWR